MTKQDMCIWLKSKKLYERARRHLHQMMTNCVNDDGGAYALLWSGVKVGYKDYTKKDIENELWKFSFENEIERDQLLCMEHIETCEDYK